MANHDVSKTAAEAGAARKGAKLDVFISYSRQDIAFVDRLQAALATESIEAFVDRDHIEKGEEWWARIKQLITDADTIVFVLSPGSVDSKVCADEVAFAEKLNKRFVPILARDLEGRAVPEALARLNYILFIPTASTSGAFDQAVADLVRTLESDIPWIREHTRLGSLAERWEGRARPNDLLLRGAELRAAETWLTARPPKAPDPTDAHRSLITLSRQAATHRQRWWVGASVSALLIVAGLTIFALLKQQAALDSATRALEAQRAAEQSRLNEEAERKRAAEQRERADSESKRAESERAQGQINYSLALARSAQAALQKKKYHTAVALAAEALPEAENARLYVPEAEQALFDAAILTNNEYLGPSASVAAADGAIFSSDGSIAIAISDVAKPRVMELTTKRLAWPKRGAPGLPTAPSKYYLNGVELSAHFGSSIVSNGKFVVKAYADYIDIFEGKNLSWKNARRIVSDGANHVVGLALSYGETPLVASSTQDNRITVWRAHTGEKTATSAGGHSEAVTGIWFNPIGSRILTISRDKTAKMWDGESLRELMTFVGHEGPLTGACFNRNGTEFATTSDDRTVRIWDAKSGGALLKIIDKDGFGPACFSPDGAEIIRAGNDIRIWSRKDGNLVATIPIRIFGAYSARYSNDGKRLFTASTDKAIIWDRQTLKPVYVIPFDGRWSSGPVFSPLDNAVLIPGPQQKPIIVPIPRTTSELVDAVYLDRRLGICVQFLKSGQFGPGTRSDNCPLEP